MSEYLVVTGMSGAGRSTAGATLEDLGWFVIDNMPSALISKVSELVDGTGSEMERVAFVVGRGGGDLDDVLPAVDALEAGRNRVRILFLDAADDVLIRRFEGTRRRHPQAARGVIDSIADERLLLSGLRDRADLVIDTGELNTNQLRTRLMEVFGGEEPGSTMRTSVLSFGFKYGVPLDVDLMFDCRFLPNPYWNESLRAQGGLDAEVRDLRAGAARDHGVPRQARRPADHADPGLHPGGEVLPDRGHGLHRRSSPLGGPGRGAVPPARGPRAADHGVPPGRRSVSGPRVVAIGGGHGLAATLRAVRRYTDQVTAIVSVADDGGSSGRLRELLHIIPPGDLRMCLVALAEPGSLLATAFDYRFAEEELAGHSLGNLILAGLIDGAPDAGGRP